MTYGLRRGAHSFALAMIAILFASGVFAQVSTEALTTKSGHRYVKRGDSWFLGMAGDKHEAKVDLSRIMLRVDASWSPGKMTAAGVAAPADVSSRSPTR